VQGTGDQFLTRTRLTYEQNRAVTGRNELDLGKDITESATLANDGVKGMCFAHLQIAELAAEGATLPQQPLKSRSVRLIAATNQDPQPTEDPHLTRGESEGAGQNSFDRHGANALTNTGAPTCGVCDGHSEQAESCAERLL
jgi:hypothetical protein